jgi:hypothetical protein
MRYFQKKSSTAFMMRMGVRRSTVMISLSPIKRVKAALHYPKILPLDFELVVPTVLKVFLISSYMAERS